jgi:hypothetical protein
MPRNGAVSTEYSVLVFNHMYVDANVPFRHLFLGAPAFHYLSPGGAMWFQRVLSVHTTPGCALHDGAIRERTSDDADAVLRSEREKLAIQ